MNIIKEKMQKSGMLLGIVLLCATIMTVILFGVQQFKLGSQLASLNQVSHLSHLLVRQQANLFSMLLVNKGSSDVLSEKLNEFAKEEFVIDASIYSTNGELLAQSTNFPGVRHRLKLEEKEQNDKGHNVQQIVEPIYSSNGVEGFLRITFDMKYGQTTQSKINQIFNQLYGELIIVFLAGALLASSVHYFLSHYRRTRQKMLDTTSIVNVLKNPATTNFHRRRKRFKR
ncbi:hemolysin regulation protein AhpA [Canicola haemoglobinophilus]|nr:YtjB family periplasmic protein [Canicola haemoglobinophilus]OOS01735.1 hemolysin regulation protein AhpA [Canicola haemoglobinophilus]